METVESFQAVLQEQENVVRALRESQREAMERENRLREKENTLATMLASAQKMQEVAATAVSAAQQKEAEWINKLQVEATTLASAQERERAATEALSEARREIKLIRESEAEWKRKLENE